MNQRAQSFGFAMPIAMPKIRWLRRYADGNKRDRGGKQVSHAVNHGRKYGQRSAQDCSDSLDDNEGNGKTNAGYGRLFFEAIALLFAEA